MKKYLTQITNAQSTQNTQSIHEMSEHKIGKFCARSTKIKDVLLTLPSIIN